MVTEALAGVGAGGQEVDDLLQVGDKVEALCREQDVEAGDPLLVPVQGLDQALEGAKLL